MHTGIMASSSYFLLSCIFGKSPRSLKSSLNLLVLLFGVGLSTTVDEVSVYPIHASFYLVKNLLQYYIFAYVDAPVYQILKNLNIISTGVLYHIILKRKLSEIQRAAFILLCAGCTTAQLNPSSDHILQTPFLGWMMAIVMALLIGFAGVYTKVKGVY
ncbi:Nucleotide-sugar transporter [Artemisia annua]|uniref:Nucleotide-sugar transporter n=1 Tax=Artemisia annua TaxID=35608 RepID=A0A2U1LN22_ARTAN|nr:Nucleotide-sugar transporter [Artemisia annua]